MVIAQHDLFQIGIDAMILIVFGAGVRFHLDELKRIKNKLEKTLTKKETEDLIDSKINEKLEIIRYEISEIKRLFDKILTIKVNKEG